LAVIWQMSEDFGYVGYFDDCETLPNENWNSSVTGQQMGANVYRRCVW